MSLPELPIPGISQGFAHYHPSFTHTQMTEYGKACREAALEEAAKVCDVHADGYNDATFCAKRIRSLKEAPSMSPKAASGTSTDWSAA